ncbi:hypothetical protein ACFYKT_18355 [Cytobacillus sp. FJAT-53684]|uniref:Uncharacterized protein n=1 Tax=Cytobacillus mangrovibacter TaxID=3299024 RepID=A0ABW6K3G1_9BACI
MNNKKIKDLKISLKIMDSVSNQELAKEVKELTLLSYETKLNDDDLLTACYSNASLISSKNEGNGFPLFEDISLIFINHCLQSAKGDASIFITTPNETYPLIEINKKPIDSNHPGITLQRIEQHLQIHTNQNFILINEKIQQYLVDNNMVFCSNGILEKNSIVEVW